MRILEILLPKGATDKGLSPQKTRQIDMLQTRMNGYMDKLSDPNTNAKAREFLKAKLQDDYTALKQHIDEIQHINEDDAVVVQYEVYDRRTGERVKGRGPYTNKNLARRARDKLDNEYGGYRYGVRPVGQKSDVLEAVHKIPLSDEDFDLVKHIMGRPIPAIAAPIFIAEFLDDDELNDQFKSLEDTNPAMDVRPLIVEWFKRVMPDQLHRFGQEVAGENQRKGLLSPIHGYDPKMYHGKNDISDGDVFGRV